MGCNKVCVALVGALVVITLIIIPTAIYVNRDESALKRTYSFYDFYNDTIRYKTYSLHWMSDNEYLHKTSEGHIYVHNAETKESSMYLSNSTFAQVDATDYILSADRKFVIFESNYSKLWRHSFTAYVWEYNIYLKKNATAEAVQVTHNGKVNEIHNGVPDWVYEEEVFASNEAIWWSPQGKYLAYLQINDTGVHNIEYSLYGNDQYPTTVFIPYPKAGCVIPRARLFVIDVENPSKQSEQCYFYCSFPSDHYLRTVTWVTDERLAVQWLPRRQDSVLLQIYDYDGTNWKETSQKSKTGWVGRYFPAAPYFAANNMSFYKVMSNDKGYKHLHYNFSEFSNDSHPKFSLRNILKKKLSLVLRISISKSGHLAPECLTCSLYQDRCQYNSAYFSLNASFFRMDCYGYNYLKQLFSPLQKYLEYTEYGGPASQNTDYVFRLEWATYLCSTEKVIIASFDGRGSGYQGDEIMHAIYGRLGTYEVEDQISAMRKLIEMGFIDKNRIGMWGWSYGGYVTSMVLGSGCGLLKCGIAVAPVAKWEYYDAVYTERYMHRPEENMESYKNSTVTGRAKNFKSVQYMLVHGTADDNVHFQQAAQISKALVENQVDFEAMWYTDKDHGLSGKARYHLYTHLNHFLQNCFAEKK
uniref:Dipeptidyl peptidase 4-like n=1 Tax=Sinocyclocheilus anshuiensis TaxID=1608454 RepID=A0A671Q6D7_9TELE